MKVLHAIDRLEIGGAERVFINITALLVGRNVSTGVLLFVQGAPLEKELDSRLQLHVLHRSNKFSTVTLYRAHKICCSYDIVHAHLRHVYAYLRLAQLLFNGGYKLILHDHAAITTGVPVRLKGIFKPQYYIGVNREQAEWAANVIGIDRKNIFLLENTVTVKISETLVQIDTKKAILIANIRRVKNIGFAIDLCKHMGWELDIYGNIIEQDYYEELLELAGNDSRCRIISGVTEFTSIYPRYSLAIHCSPEETGPLVLIEYLAAGLPFIAFKTGSAAGAIAEYIPQLFMNDFVPGNWARRIPEILNAAGLPARMQALYKENFNPDYYIGKCLEIYRNVRS